MSAVLAHDFTAEEEAEIEAACRAFKACEIPSFQESPLDRKKIDNCAGMSFAEALGKLGGKLPAGNAYMLTGER
jgi:hypothetical protein